MDTEFGCSCPHKRACLLGVIGTGNATLGFQRMYWCSAGIKTLLYFFGEYSVNFLGDEGIGWSVCQSEGPEQSLPIRVAWRFNLPTYLYLLNGLTLLVTCLTYQVMDPSRQHCQRGP